MAAWCAGPHLERIAQNTVTTVTRISWTRLGSWFGVAISAILLVLILRKAQDLSAVRDALASADYRWVAVAAALYLLAFIPRGMRWGRLLVGVRQLPLTSLIKVAVIGFMANNVLPLRLGEFVRAYVLGRKEHVSTAATLATIVVERVLDGLTLVLAMSVILAIYPFPLWVKRVGEATSVLFVGALVAILFLAYRGDLVRSLAARVLRPLPSTVAGKVSQLLDAFDSGIHMMRRPVDAIVAAGLSVVIWAIEFVVYTRVLAAFGPAIQRELGQPVPLHLVVLLLVVLNFGVMVPTAPGYIGAFQAAIIVVLAGVVGLSNPLAFSIAWVLWAVMVLPVVLLGFVFLSSEQLDVRSLLSSRGAATQLPRQPVPVPAEVLGDSRH